MSEKFGFVPEKLQSAQQVNTWCSSHTNNKINQIIDNVDFESILISAIHFKADWMVQFDKT